MAERPTFPYNGYVIEMKHFPERYGKIAGRFAVHEGTLDGRICLVQTIPGETFLTEKEADEYSLTVAKTWIDKNPA